MITTPAVRPPAIGETAPDFTLPSTSGTAVTLSQYRGDRPVLLAFFPLAFSGTCTRELCDMTEDFPRFDATRVVMAPISVDSTYALREYKQKYAMPFDLLSDFHREVSRAYGVYWPHKGYANRSYFLIDVHGTVRWSHVEEHPGHKRDNAELLARLNEL
jgi:peroxiredoxin (alkyl hydroperoxide reductase subunit C)